MKLSGLPLVFGVQGWRMLSIRRLAEQPGDLAGAVIGHDGHTASAEPAAARDQEAGHRPAPFVGVARRHRQGAWHRLWRHGESRSPCPRWHCASCR